MLQKTLSAELQETKKTAYRVLAETTFRARQKEIQLARLWLQKYNLLQVFEDLPKEKKRKFMDTFVWGPNATGASAKRSLLEL